MDINMAQDENRKIYEQLLEEGLIDDMFPKGTITGDWNKDRKFFNKHMQEQTFLPEELTHFDDEENYYE